MEQGQDQLTERTTLTLEQASIVVNKVLNSNFIIKMMIPKYANAQKAIAVIPRLLVIIDKDNEGHEILKALDLIQ